MGVPAFFRWLTLACPQIVKKAVEFIDYEPGDLPEDYPNPQIGCLYLDMNGIIHPCTHPQGETTIPVPTCEEEMWENIRDYVDMLVNIVNPQKLIYFAVDGVAPRAKMNQQRGRRFKTARDILEGTSRKKKLLDLWRREGIDMPKELAENNHWDHNVITPGTDFMLKVSNVIKEYIVDRLENCKQWKGLKVVFSDASVPGEGEHKILDYMRRQRPQKGYNPNTSHCIYGADADLIMLSLSTHEPHCYVIRESITFNFRKKKREGDENDAVNIDEREAQILHLTGRRFNVEFCFVTISIVREYIEAYLSPAAEKMNYPWDLERVIDDFVLLCFFAGNDFLPHLPALNISQGGIEILLHLYKRVLPFLGGYLSNNGEVELDKLEFFLREFSYAEEDILKQLENSRIAFCKRNVYSRYEVPERLEKLSTKVEALAEEMEMKEESKPKNVLQFGPSQTQPPQKDLLAKPKISFEQEDPKKQADLKRKFKNELEQISKFEEAKDLRQLESIYFEGDADYKETYYRMKFDLDSLDADSFLSTVKDYFVEGIIWNLRYYYQGCDSWEWYYPFYYAPFPSDLKNLSHLQSKKFPTGKPFDCLEQLMAVLPPYSSHALPTSFRDLMYEPTSEIIDFYPKSFKVDLVGKKHAWLGEVILPMIDEIRLTKALKKKEEQLTEEEKIRNKRGTYVFLFNKQYSNGEVITEKSDSYQEIKGVFNALELKELVPDRKDNTNILAFSYDPPHYEGHKCNLLEGVKMPPRYLPSNYADYEHRSKMTDICISILERSLKSLDYSHMKRAKPQTDYIGDEEELSKPMKRVKLSQM